MTDDEKQKKKVDDPKLGALEALLRVSNDIAGEAYKKATISINPSIVDAGIGRAIVRPAAQTEISFMGEYLKTANGISIPITTGRHSGSVFDLENNFVTTRLTESPITREEIEKLIDKKTSKKDGDVKREEIPEIVIEVMKKQNEQKEENVNAAEKQSFAIMSKNFLEGKVFIWRCRCGEILDEFKQEEDIERVKFYLSEFKKGNLKRCGKKGYGNWFELRGGEFICSESALLDKEFKVPKEKN
jgi:hypothetical protein